MSAVRAGLLPLYLKMHDDFFPERREAVARYIQSVRSALEGAGLCITLAPVCRVKEEFDAAARDFAALELDALITLHVVYSPSLECIDALERLGLPIIVLDTTPDRDFGENPAPARVRPNIGIHGVQDMCSMLTRRGVPYEIAAGHMIGSDVIARVAALARAAAAAKLMKTGRVGTIGGVYPGMGDFRISPERMRDELGAVVVEADFTSGRYAVSEGEIDAELEREGCEFDIKCDVDDDYRESTRANLMVRRWLEDEKLCAFTANFMGIKKAGGLPRMPFMEASKAMGRGVGYAGEGDTLTSLLMAALARICPECCFSEMFAPGWSDGTIFLSHMGEISPPLCAKRPQVHKMNMLFSDTGDVACLYGALKAGRAALVNITPLARGFRLICTAVEMLEKPLAPGFERMVTGWMRPGAPVAEFLEEYSRLGGTHHLVLCYGADIRALEAFGRMMGFDTRRI